MGDPSSLPQPPKEDPEALVLRGKPRSAVRFRRGLIVGVTGAVAGVLIGFSWLALQPPGVRKAEARLEGDEPAGTAARETLANLPASYGVAPRLGPPLPGDLGRAIVAQKGEVDSVQTTGESSQATGDDGVEAARERAESVRRAAEASPVLVQLEGAPNLRTAAKPQTADGTAANMPPSSAEVPANQVRKIAFARSGDGDRDKGELQEAPSVWTLSAGTIIPASLITGLNSDLPGEVLAQVSANVRDSATGRTILIPQGARLIGRYDSAVAYGQRRALVIWTRIVFPDGASLDLDHEPATDSAGNAGLEDRVDSHGWQLLKGIAFSTLLGVSSELSLGGDSGLSRAIRESVQQNSADAGDRITARNLDVQPTIRVRAGWPVRVLLDKDLVLRPWRG